jgi:HK97 family phage major capsid protein
LIEDSPTAVTALLKARWLIGDDTTKEFTMNVRDILSKNASLKAEAETLWASAAEGKGFSDAQKSRYDEIKAELTKNQDLVAAAAEISSFKGEVKAAVGKSEEVAEGRASKEYESAYKQYVMSRGSVMPAILAANVSEADFASSGVVLPTTFEQQVVQLANLDSVMRQLATIIPTTMDIPFPVETARGNAAETDEAPGSSGSNNYHVDDPTFAIKKLTAYKITKKLPVSEELFQDYNAFQAYVVNNLGRSIAEFEEGWFINGTGSSQPTGVVTAATVGKVSATGHTVTLDFISDLNDLVGSLKSIYLNGASWLMNRTTKAYLRKAVATTGQPLWPANEQTLLGYPVNLSDQMPNQAASAKPILFGNFKQAVLIGDRGGIQTRILDQPLADQGMIEFIGKRRTDQIVLLPEAIKYLQNSAS